MKESPLSAFQLYIDETMLRLMQKYAIHPAHLDDKNFNCPLEELEKFVGLQITRGVLERKNTPVKQLWIKEWGQPIFASTLSRNRFESIMKHQRFDIISTRAESRTKVRKVLPYFRNMKCLYRKLSKVLCPKSKFNNR